MGQYYLIANLSKRQFIYPHRFGDGLKLLEFGDSSSGTMCGLAVLLSNGNGQGGGDLDAEDPIIGSWAGDRIVVAGDYGDPGRWIADVPEEEKARIARKVFTEGYQEASRVNLYFVARETYEDVSDQVIRAMLKDDCLRERLRETAELQRDCWCTPMVRWRRVSRNCWSDALPHAPVQRCAGDWVSASETPNR